MMQLMSIMLLLSVAWFIHYQRHAVHRPRLVYADTPLNQQLLQLLPRLQRPYKPTPWAYNTHLQLIWLILKDKFAPTMQYHREILRMADGGTTALDWGPTNDNPSTPTIVVLHTIGGSPHSMRSFVRYLYETTGWRVVVCTRRGHDDLPFTAPRYNTMGHVDDLREQITHIQQQLPHSPLYGVGVSAGSALLVRYLGEEQENAAFTAGVAYCPGYDLRVAFNRVLPFYSRKMMASLRQKFLQPHAEVLQQKPGFNEALQANNLAELHTHLYGVAGYSCTETYLAGTNPIAVMPHITVPLLALNADDDPVCVKQNAIEHEPMVRQMPAALQVCTQRGSHCAFFEGWRANSWANALIAEYLQAVEAKRS